MRTLAKGAYFKGAGLYMLAIRMPLWEAICFTQTGQRFGELTANSDQISAQESLCAEVCVRQWISPPLRAPFAKRRKRFNRETQNHGQ